MMADQNNSGRNTSAGSIDKDNTENNDEDDEDDFELDELTRLQQLVSNADFNGQFNTKFDDNCPFNFIHSICSDEAERSYAMYQILKRKYPRNKYEFALLERKFLKYSNQIISVERKTEIEEDVKSQMDKTQC